MPMGDVVLKQVAPQTVAAIREVIPTHSTVERLFFEVETFVAQHDLKIVGAPLDIWHDTEYRKHDVDAEVGLPVEGMAQSKGNVAVRQLPGIELAACMIHQGSYDTIGQSYATMLK